MVGPPLIPPEGPDPDVDYVPSAAVLATLPSPNPNLREVSFDTPNELFDVEIPGPVLRAASMPDIRILRGLLRYGFPATNYTVGPLNGPWESALTNALRAGLTDHVKLLLEYGANPNGFPDWCFDAASTRFLRGRAHSETVTAGCYLRGRARAFETMRQNAGGIETGQQSLLTDGELNQRRKSRSRFWAEPDFPRSDFPTNSPMPALAVAIQFRDTALYDLLKSYGADEMAWIETLPSTVEGHTPSRWAVEPPLWIATTNQDKDMLRFVLDRGHKPDLFPEALITRSRNALAYAVSQQPPWVTGLDMMTPRSDTSLLTPLFRCHVLHFAVATLDLSLVTHVVNNIGEDRSSVMRQIPRTALGHTLLHVASLPLHDGVVNMHSEPIYLSIHEFRTTTTSWQPQELASKPPAARITPVMGGPRGRGRGRARGGLVMEHSLEPGPTFHEVPQDQLQAQARVMLYLFQCLQECTAQGEEEDELAKQDVHGNTPLHYLAATRNPDRGLIDTLIKEQHRSLRSSDRAWESVPNLWGFTAKDLYSSGQAAKVEWAKEYMPFWKND